MDVYGNIYKILKNFYRYKVLYKNLKFSTSILLSSYFNFSRAKNVKLNIIMGNAAETYVFAAYFLGFHLVIYKHS